MPENKNTQQCSSLRRFIARAKRVLSLVYLVLQILKLLLEFWK